MNEAQFILMAKFFTRVRHKTDPDNERLKKLDSKWIKKYGEQLNCKKGEDVAKLRANQEVINDIMMGM